MGVVSIAGLKGEALANAMMKAETKAKRRATLSICGLGWMDEVEALDRQAVEVAPRAALAEGIASRRAALDAASSETPAGDVSTDGEVVTPSTAAPSAPCDHKRRSADRHRRGRQVFALRRTARGGPRKGPTSA